jgi:hypothetical protein
MIKVKARINYNSCSIYNDPEQIINKLIFVFMVTIYDLADLHGFCPQDK